MQFIVGSRENTRDQVLAARFPGRDLVDYLFEHNSYYFDPFLAMAKFRRLVLTSSPISRPIPIYTLKPHTTMKLDDSLEATNYPLITDEDFKNPELLHEKMDAMTSDTKPTRPSSSIVVNTDIESAIKNQKAKEAMDALNKKTVRKHLPDIPTKFYTLLDTEDGHYLDGDLKMRRYHYRKDGLAAKVASYLVKWATFLFSNLDPNVEYFPLFDLPTQYVYDWPQENEADVRRRMTDIIREDMEKENADGDSVIFEYLYDYSLIAGSLMDLAAAIIAGRNYDSPGTRFGMALAQMATFVYEAAQKDLDETHPLPSRSRTFADFSFSVTRLGQGTENDQRNVFCDYVVADQTTNRTQGDKLIPVFFDTAFRDNDNGDLVRRTLELKLEDGVDYPHPTMTARPDWLLTYGGATLITGETKIKDDIKEGMTKYTAAALAQLCYSETALLVHTTNYNVRIMRYSIDDSNDRMNLRCHVHGCRKYDITSRSDSDDTRFDNETSQKLPQFQPPCAVPISTADAQAWLLLPVKARDLLHACFEAMDVIVSELLKKNVLKIEHDWSLIKRLDMLPTPRYIPGYGRPRYIHMQNFYRYSGQGMWIMERLLNEDDELTKFAKENLNKVYCSSSRIKDDEKRRCCKKMMDKNEELSAWREYRGVTGLRFKKESK